MNLGGEADARAPAREARRRRDRGGLPDRERGRLRGGARRGARAARGASSAASRAPARRTSSARPQALEGARAAAHPHLHRDQRHPPRAQAAHEPRARARGGGPRRPPGARALRRRRVLGRGRDALGLGLPGARSSASALEAGASTLNVPDTVGYTTPDEYAALIRHLLRARRRRRRGGLQRPLPRRPRPRGGEQPRGGARGRAPDRVHGERHRRARRQHVDGRGA